MRAVKLQLTSHHLPLLAPTTLVVIDGCSAIRFDSSILIPLQPPILFALHQIQTNNQRKERCCRLVAHRSYALFDPESPSESHFARPCVEP